MRWAVTADSRRVADILILARAAFMPYAPSVHDDDATHAWVRDQLIPTGGVTLAEREGEPVGVMATSRRPDGAWIDQMSVHPAWVGQGIGSMLLARALQSLASPNSPIRLYTFQQNVMARRFYERHGFVATCLTLGEANEENCPDVLYEYHARPAPD